MRKIIKIGDTEYNMKSSAYTQFKYKNDTGRKLLTDVQSLMKLQDISNEDALGEMDDLMDIILRIAYVMIEEGDPKQVESYEAFLKQVDGLFDNQDWIVDVITLATSPISRGIQGTPQQKEQ